MRKSVTRGFIGAVVALAVCCGTAIAETRRTELVSVGATADSGFAGASRDGTRAVFTTGAALTPDDTDGLCDRGYDPDTGVTFPQEPCLDLYLRDLKTGTTKLVSTGPLGGSGHFDATFAGMSEDGRRVFFTTAERLVPADTDNASDFYVRNVDSGTTDLVSIGPAGGNGPFGVSYFATFLKVTNDGSRVFFETDEPLTSGDTNTFPDIYVRDLNTGTTELVSAGSDGHAAGAAYWFTITADGSKAWFETSAPLVPEDTDRCKYGNVVSGCDDVYERDLATSTSTLVSTGPRANQSETRAEFVGASADGSHVFFQTNETLVDEDVEAGCPDPSDDQRTRCRDIYERFHGTTTLISTGPNKTGHDSSGALKGTSDPAYSGHVSSDGSRVFFVTAESLLSSDTNSSLDVYERRAGTTSLVSAIVPGPAPQPGEYGGVVLAGMSKDGSRVFMLTNQQWAPDDFNGKWDVYVRKADGALDRVTPGEGTPGWYDRNVIGTSDDGTRFVYSVYGTYGSPTAARNVYEWHDGVTTLVSQGPNGTVGHADMPAGTVNPMADGGRRIFFDAHPALTPDANGSWNVYVSIANEPPKCDSVKPDRAVLWPPNRKFHAVGLSGATDPDGDPVTLSITGVTQDEPVRGGRDARHATGDAAVSLRAQRDARGDGRVYRIAFEATDGQGGSCDGQVTVSVPRQRKTQAVDSAPPSYDSFAP